ncbi:MAG TPA: pesticin C-terminus-like muramidase [Tahibacter sp.]|nr:pesticin C-terminus-like muramidase [Tahibacter sp.]
MTDPQSPAGAAPVIPLPWNAPAAAPTPQLPGPWKAPPPPTKEDLLGADDRDILAEYRAQYEAREARYAQCVEDAKADQAKRDAEQEQIDADWNDKTKKRPKKKPKPKTSVRKCTLRHPKVACVPPDADPQGQFGTDLGNALNKAGGTAIDFAQVAKWEGGVHLNAYQPWFPDMVKQPDGTFAPTLQERKGQAPRLDGTMVTATARNRSGVTVGKGIDLGPQGKDAYLAELESFNKKANILTPEELKQLKDKLGPYFGKRMAEACVYLRAHPLTMTQKELDLLHYRAATDALDKAKAAYTAQTGKSFSSLPVEAQTSLFSRQYQTGQPPGSTVLDHIGAGNYASASAGFTRERSYLAGLGNAPAPATPPAPTHP